MSYTEIYKFEKNGTAVLVAEIKNAYRGAMAIWNYVDEKYLPPYEPDWAYLIRDTDPGRKFHRSSDMMGDSLKEVWDLFREDRVSETDKICLGSSFDNVIVYKKDFVKLINAFNEFDGETSLKEQARVVESLLNDNDCIAVGWNQTSVNGDTWSNYSYDEVTEESASYNILTQNEHWSLFTDDKVSV